MNLKPIAISFALPISFASIPMAIASPDGHDNPPISISSGDWTFSFGGYARTGAIWKSFDGDAPKDATDHKAGFVVLNGRMNFGLKYKDLISGRISLDGAGGVNALNGKSSGNVALKDAYLDFDIVLAFRIKAGQFKPPIDFESLTSTPDANFIEQSVVSKGGNSNLYNKTDYNSGFEPGRQIGVSFYSDMLEFQSVGFRYNVAVTNGQTALSKAAEEGYFAAYGRLELGLKKSLYGDSAPGTFFTIALSGSVELREAKIDENDDTDSLGHRYRAAGELHARYKGIEADFEAIWERYDVLDLDDSLVDDGKYTGKRRYKALDKLGIVAQISYTLPIEYFRFQIGYRFAMMQPVMDNAKSFDSVDLYQHTASLGYVVENYPIIVRADYTRNDETGPEIHNDTIFGIVQVRW